MGTISNFQGFNTKQIAQNGLETEVKPTPLNRFDKLFASGFHFPCLTLRPLSFEGVVNIPTPIEGEGGGGQNQPVEFHFFLLGNPGIVIQPLEWNCKVTFLNKPWALV